MIKVKLSHFQNFVEFLNTLPTSSYATVSAAVEATYPGIRLLYISRRGEIVNPAMLQLDGVWHLEFDNRDMYTEFMLRWG